jgi:hypothetical protein
LATEPYENPRHSNATISLPHDPAALFVIETLFEWNSRNIKRRPDEVTIFDDDLPHKNTTFVNVQG